MLFVQTHYTLATEEAERIRGSSSVYEPVKLTGDVEQRKQRRQQNKT